jgi:uncharacterized protein (DUF983 family)
MRKLKVKYGIDVETAREFPMLGAAYRCPECKNGYKLKRYGTTMATCGGCDKNYKID